MPGPTSPPSAAWRRRAACGLAVLSLLASLAYVLAPVSRPTPVYSWPAAAGDSAAVAVPLMRYQPDSLVVTVPCTAARTATADSPVLVTTTPGGRLTDLALPAGLLVQVVDGRLQVSTAGTTFDPQPVPATGDCTWTLTSDAQRTTLDRDGAVVAEEPGDVRPSVAGVASDLPDPAGIRVAVTADTVWQTSPSAVKLALGALAVLSLAAALVLVALHDRQTARRRPGAGTPAPRGPTEDTATPARPRRRGLRVLVDLAVALLLALWAVIGPLSIDDGYIAGIIRSRDANGYVSDVYRWFNAPEAPFGWFYDVFDLWSRISASTPWMRVPSVALGLLTWLVLARGLLPRLRLGDGLGSYAAAATVFAVWWLPFGLGLRPEAWVAAGVAVVLVLVERGIATQRALPVLAGLVVAAATLAVTPTGAVAFLPYLAAAVPLVRMALDRTGLGWPALLAIGLAATATTVLFMFGDQTLASVRLANQLRTELPGSVDWQDEYQRYAALLTRGDVQGPISRRVPVLLTALAALGIAVRYRYLPAGVRPLVARLLWVQGLALVVLLFTPTKWTLHFGAFVAPGTALVLVAVHLFSRRALTPGPATGDGGRRPVAVSWIVATGAGLTATGVVTALAYAGYNQWAWISDLAIPWNTVAPLLLGAQVSTLALVLAALAALTAAAAAVWARARDRSEVRLPGARWLPSPGAVVLLVVAATVVLEVGSFVKATETRRDTYTLAGDAVSTLSGDPCGLAERLSVETDPTAGLLPVAPTGTAGSAADGATADGPRADGFRSVPAGAAGSAAEATGTTLQMAGQPLPGWSADGHTGAAGTGPATLTTEWFSLTEPLRTGAVPLVVTLAGDTGVGVRVVAEFGTLAGSAVTAGAREDVADPGDGPTARDARIVVPAGDTPPDVVRLLVEDGGDPLSEPLSVSVPRGPVTTSFDAVVPATEPALVDWPVAAVFPCQELGVQAAGLTDVPGWRIAPARPSHDGDIIVAGFVGGPYAEARSLVDEVEYPVYLDARPLERPVSLYRWVPRVALEAPADDVTDEQVSGLAD